MILRLVQMFTADAREALVKELVRREVREDLGVELEDLLNPIKVPNPKPKTPRPNPSTLHLRL